MFEPGIELEALPRHRRAGQLLQNRQQMESKRSSCGACGENFHQYLLNSTLHGLKYVADRKISRWERCYFTCMFLLVIVLSGYFISNVWDKWKTSPLIVTLGAHGTSVKDIPFPSVTICNTNQAMKSAVSDIPRESEEYAVLQSICRHSVDENVTNSVAGTWNTFRKVLIKVAQPCERMLIACQFGGNTIDCMHLFNSILTDGGICCIFNGVHRKFLMNFSYNRSENVHTNDVMDEMANIWTPETGFQSEELKNHRHGYPKPGLGSGNQLGLSVILNAKRSEYYCSSSSGLGFKVLLNSPNELPEIDYYGLGISTGFESRIIATPILAKASKSVRSIPMQIRQCVYEDENFLTFYKIYSRRNCQSECETKIMNEHCNCMLYFMPRPHHNMTICGRADAECVEKVKTELRSAANDTFKYICPYGCHAIKYEMGLSATPIFDEAPLLKKKNLSTENSAILHVYYQSTYYQSQNKEELIGFTEFLSYTGGLLSLFMGFSVFSIVEVFYFLSIQPYSSYLKDVERRRYRIKRFFHRVRRFKIRGTGPPNDDDDSVNRSNHTLFPHAI